MSAAEESGCSELQKMSSYMDKNIDVKIVVRKM